MPKKYIKETAEISKKEIEKIFLEGFVDERTIRKDSRTCGRIRVPKRFQGQRVRIIIIPMEEFINLDFK